MSEIWMMGWFTGAALAASLTMACARTQGKPMLQPGAEVPALTAFDQHGQQQGTASQRGKPLVVYFYPKDATPGCTKEACAFRDVWDRYEAAGVQVFGVSADERGAHEKFAAEHKLPFPILADPERVWIDAFGVPTRMGMASRVSFLVGPDGTIAKVYPEVDPGVHAAQVLQDAQALSRGR